jgi:hypothetical protein
LARIDFDGILGELAEGTQVMRLHASPPECPVRGDGIDSTHPTCRPVDPFRRLREPWVTTLRAQMPREAAQVKTACGTVLATFWIRVNAQQQLEVGGHPGLGLSDQEHALRTRFRVSDIACGSEASRAPRNELRWLASSSTFTLASRRSSSSEKAVSASSRGTHLPPGDRSVATWTASLDTRGCGSVGGG